MTVVQVRVSSCWDVLAFVSLLNSLSCSMGAVRVTVPEGQVVAIRGQPVVLGCEFTPVPGSDISKLVVTWQRQEDSQVVHSYYYQRDQLERQSEVYRNRTALFNEELEKGNASLRIAEVGPRDVGQYQCIVSMSSGMDRAKLQLVYGAFYTEPRLSISFSATEVTMQYEAEGFPKPEVRWLGEQGQNLSHHTEVLQGAEGEVGLFYLKSSYVAHAPTLNITFVLKNQLLNQDLQRPVNLRYTADSSNGVAIALGVLCSALVVVFLFIFLYKKKKLCLK